MLNGGHIAGWAVEDPALLAQIDSALNALGSQEAFDARYPQAKGGAPLTLAVGDGNHSLASAKAAGGAEKDPDPGAAADPPGPLVPG